MPNISQEERDLKAPVWDMSQERVFVFTLVNQRLQFLILFCSIVVAGAINTQSQEGMQFILILGAIISWLFGAVIVRTQTRLTTVLNIIEQDPTHPYTLVTLQTKQKYRIQPLVSYIIPAICSITLTIGGILSVFSILTV
ncbi:MAG: hypothetical protein HRT52_07530 [Colwellia sp.]|nr:hypothetical protein [Colwellia sp.]